MTDAQTIEDTFHAAKLEILGPEPQEPGAKVIYNRALVALEPYIEIFEQSLADPDAMAANISVLGVHLRKVAEGIDHPQLEKLERDMGSTIYTDARQRFVDHYRPAVDAL